MPSRVDIDVRAARKMRENGATWEVIGQKFGIAGETAHRKVDLAYKDEMRTLSRRARRREEQEAVEVYATAKIEPDTRTWQQKLFGDPPLGRSALARRTT